MQKTGVWEALQPKLVLAENIRQALQFVQTGNAEAGVVARSTADVPEVSWKPIDARLHAPLEQALGIPKGTPNEALARRFAAFLIGREGQAVLGSAGYESPGKRPRR
jgi:molybdate transport system substrate-binding protein